MTRGCRYGPLHYAAQNGHQEVAQPLLAEGANVNMKDKSGQRWLHLAAWDGS